MTLHESETKLAEINNSIAELLRERENQKNLVYAKAMEIREHAREAINCSDVGNI